VLDVQIHQPQSQRATAAARGLGVQSQQQRVQNHIAPQLRATALICSNSPTVNARRTLGSRRAVTVVGEIVRSRQA
jgi:hypothetical protein